MCIIICSQYHTTLLKREQENCHMLCLMSTDTVSTAFEQNHFLLFRMTQKKVFLYMSTQQVCGNLKLK